jgi:hypothetical protein
LAALDITTVVTGVRGPGKCLNSFTAATPVLLADGTSKPIGEVKVGDEVAATDPASGETTAEAVEVLHDHLDRELVDLTVRLSDDATAVINTTANHPFWSRTSGAWTDAAKLAEGDELLAVDDTVTVVETHAYSGAQHMLNLTVANIHTYYVLADNTPVLVHNCGGKHRAEGESTQSADYKPKHLRQGTPDWIPLKHAAAGAADGALTKWDASLPSKALGFLPEGNIKTGLTAFGRTAYGAHYGRKAYQESGGGYPAVHRAPDPYRGRHRAE